MENELLHLWVTITFVGLTAVFGKFSYFSSLCLWIAIAKKRKKLNYADMRVVHIECVLSHCQQVSETCVATVGRVSNIDHNKRIIGKAGRNRWLGIRPSSGLWQRKGGWAGRKIKPLPPMKIYVNQPSASARTWARHLTGPRQTWRDFMICIKSQSGK